jgi:hypothetical protein
MFRNLARLSAWMVTILFLLVALTAASTYGAAQMAAEKPTAPQTVTGCLQKGAEPGGYFLVTSDKHWELYENGKISLSDHVGQTVTVTGTLPTRTAAQEEKSQPYEKKETGTRMHGDFQVSALKVVSQTCSK